MALRIDSHQHFWHYDPTQHIWMTGKMERLKRDYLPADLQLVMAESNIQGTVAVQARQNLEETEWLLALAGATPFIKGVVGWVDLRSSAVAAQIAKYAEHPRLVGLRHVVHDEADDLFMLRDDFVRGIRAMQAYDLAYDLLLFPRHLPVAVDLVRQFPDQIFVLDHIAKPLIKDGVLEPWNTQIRALASMDNVYCKVSGMVTEAAWERWARANFRPYLEVVFDCFGTERLLFGSDWPVCTLSGSYAEVVGLVSEYIGQFSEAEQAAVMGGNAERIYRL